MRNANGTGSIFKKKSKSRKPYVIRAGAYLSQDGKYKRPIIGQAKTLKEAQKILADYNSKKLNIEYSDLKLIDLFNRWTDSKHARSIKTEDTFKRYCNDFTIVFENLLQKPF